MKKFFYGLIIGLIIGAGGCFYLVSKINNMKGGLADKIKEYVQPEVHVSEQVLKEKLVTCSELTTMKYEIAGQISREEQYSLLKELGINHGKKSFTVNYKASVNLAIDLTQADIKVDSTNTVRLKLPSAKVQSLTVPSESLEIVSEKKSLINWENKNDMIEALRDCEEHAKKNCDMNDLVKKANDEAVKCLQSLLSPMVENADGTKPYQVEIIIEDNSAPAEVPAAK